MMECRNNGNFRGGGNGVGVTALAGFSRDGSYDDARIASLYHRSADC